MLIFARRSKVTGRGAGRAAVLALAAATATGMACHGGEGDDAGFADPDVHRPTGAHAWGRIVLGEEHRASGGGNATPAVSAAFAPDATAETSCHAEVEGCTFERKPDCGRPGCGANQTCGFDDSCRATCFDVCDAECKEDEICYFPSPGIAGCRATETFDAGALTFSGTTFGITLFPPYVFEGQMSGSPFAPDAELSVHASGASGAGFASFSRAFSGTEFIRSNIGDLTESDISGDEPISIGWIPGDDTIVISARVEGENGASNVVRCTADDAGGTFELPRAALEQALDGEMLENLRLTIERQRVTAYAGLETTGHLASVTLPQEAWLELVTRSSESAHCKPSRGCFDHFIPAYGSCQGHANACEDHNGFDTPCASPPGHGEDPTVCTPRCWFNDASVCPAAPDGTAIAVCDQERCHLDCSGEEGGSQCPEGMQCTSGWCTWAPKP